MNNSADVFSGCMPALMTPCNADGVVDLDALVRKGAELIDAGMSALIYCGSMGDWPLLTDEQRMEGVARLCDAGLPVIVGTGAQNSARAVTLATHAQDVGASGLMVIPRVLSRGNAPDAQRSHFADILNAAPNLPAVIYNSPYYGFETKADLFFDLRTRHSNLVGFKEFGGAQAMRCAAEHITSADPDIALMVGVDTQAYHGFVNCGANGAITGIGNALPREVLRLVELCEQAARGDAEARELAWELDKALHVLATFDESPDLVLYYKHLMVLEGNPEYTYQLHASDVLPAPQRAYLEAQWKLFRNWWDSWPGAA